MKLSREIYKISERTNVSSAIHFGVKSRHVEELANYVRTVIRDKKLSYRDVANASQGLINHSTVGDIVNSNVSSPTILSLQGLAKGLGVSEELIFSIARGKKISFDSIVKQRFDDLAAGYLLLPEETQKAIEPFIGALEITINNKVSSEPDIGKKKQRKTKQASEIPVVTQTSFQEKK